MLKTLTRLVENLKDFLISQVREENLKISKEKILKGRNGRRHLFVLNIKKWAI